MIPGGPQTSAKGFSDDFTARTWFGFNPCSSQSSLLVTSPASESPSVAMSVPLWCFPTIRLLKEQQPEPSLTSLRTASIIALAVASNQVWSMQFNAGSNQHGSPTLPALYILHCICANSGGSGYCNSILISPVFAITTTASTTAFPSTQPFSGSETACNLTWE